MRVLRAKSLSRVQLFVTLTDDSSPAPLPMGCSRQDWSGFPCPLPRDLPTQGLNPGLLWVLHRRQTLPLSRREDHPSLNAPHQFDLHIFRPTIRVRWPCPLVQRKHLSDDAYGMFFQSLNDLFRPARAAPLVSKDLGNRTTSRPPALVSHRLKRDQ